MEVAADDPGAAHFRGTAEGVLAEGTEVAGQPVRAGHQRDSGGRDGAGQDHLGHRAAGTPLREQEELRAVPGGGAQLDAVQLAGGAEEVLSVHERAAVLGQPAAAQDAAQVLLAAADGPLPLALPRDRDQLPAHRVRREGLPPPQVAVHDFG